MKHIRMNIDLLARRLSLAAGLMDFSTGLGLAVLPAFTLKLMLVAPPGEEALIFVRFVGVFVAAVGAAYLWALLRPVERLRVVLGATCLFRIGAGTFTLVGVCAGWLGVAWLTVTAADWFLVGAQSWLIARGAGRGN